MSTNGENTKAISICFVANFYKTIFFHEIAKKLSSHGINICWVVTKVEQYQWLKDLYPVENILQLNRDFVNRPEAIVDDFKINELVFGDRVWKHEVEKGIKFLSNIQRPIYTFLETHKVRFIFSEITWAHELILRRMAKNRPELNCQFLECSLIRIPNNRFAFFVDETQYDMLEFDNPVTAKPIAVEKPSYLGINDKIVEKSKSISGRLNRLKRFFTGENIDARDPNVITKFLARVRVAAQEELNKSSYYWINRVDFEKIKNEKYIFLGFHKQPEASIDVSGRYYEDQAQNVTNLWRILPPGWKIVLKEHTNAIGDRSFGFYKRLLSFPNVVVVNEKTDSKLIIENSSLVATVTGTIAYEAALLKKPAITFSKVFFNRINYCRYTPLDELVKYDSLTTLVNELNSQVDNRIEFSNFLLKNTFDGYITDPNTDPSVLNEDNLQKVCHAFLKVIEDHGQRNST